MVIIRLGIDTRMVRPDSGSFLRCRTQEAGLLELEVVHLLLAVHLDDQRDEEDEEGSAGDPGGLAGAFEQLLGNESGVRYCLLAPRDDWGLRELSNYATLLILGVPSVGERNSASSCLGRHGRDQREDNSAVALRTQNRGFFPFFNFENEG